MTDNSTPTSLLAVQLLKDIGKAAQERGEVDIRKVFTEMMVVYGTVISNLPCRPEDLPQHLETALENYVMATSLLPYEGAELLERSEEGVRLYKMAEEAARNGHTLAVVDDFAEKPSMEFCFLPGSLVEMRDDARAEREKQARRKQDIFTAVANGNANAAAAPASVPLPPA